MNLLLTCWPGNRRSVEGDYALDRTIYVKNQLYLLASLEHSLDQITFLFPEHPDREKLMVLVPDRIKNTNVVKFQCPNAPDVSYGHCIEYFQTEQEHHDHYIFLEDDYAFVADNFDKILLDLLKLQQCDYLCTLVLDYLPGFNVHDEQYVHAAISNGILTMRALDVVAKYRQQHGPLCARIADGEGQFKFSRLITEAGMKVDDYKEYTAPFWKGFVEEFRPSATKSLIVPMQQIHLPQVLKHLLPLL